MKNEKKKRKPSFVKTSEGKGKKVVVAMSGGVDSSVAAALLKRTGVDELRSSSRFANARVVVDELRSSSRFANARVFDVIGAFMKFWKAPDNNGLVGGWNRCCSPESETRARKVATKLKIPFYAFNFEKEFKKKIVDYFLDGYKKGITPNPCVICNKEIKFGLLLEKALALDADFVATGHYAKKIQNPKSKIQKLLRAKDKTKDQSYFLWQLNQKQLKHILFPVGNYTKNQVRKLAKKFKLPVLNISESQEICFIQTTMGDEASASSSPFASARVNDFLKKYLKPKPGKIIDTQGKVIGEHEGLYFYTIGQRKGIRLSGGPYYVLDKDLKKNRLIVTKNEKDLYKKELVCKNVNWISGKTPKLPLKVKAKIRYRHQLASAIISRHLGPKVYSLKFKVAQRSITPGQSVVFYKGEELLGGGIIC
ncbi:MAG: tRNA 2-thiouridine(34) synthase MnmA [bacterium]|nr:tRNA 2-thiouridine(34) synthase MnmA [bacterium]